MRRPHTEHLGDEAAYFVIGFKRLGNNMTPRDEPVGGVTVVVAAKPSHRSGPFT